MPIAKRSRDVQVPAPEKDDGVLGLFMDPLPAARVLYNEVSPKSIPVSDLVALMRTPENNESVEVVYRNRVKSRMTAIRTFCVLCVGGQPRLVRKCDNVRCPLWGFRMGSNPFRKEGEAK